MSDAATAPDPLVTEPKSSFGKGLAQGLGVAVLIYAGIVGWLWHAGPETVQQEQAKNISQSALVQRPEQTQVVPVPVEEATPAEPVVVEPAPTETPVVGEPAPAAQAVPVTPVATEETKPEPGAVEEKPAPVIEEVPAAVAANDNAALAVAPVAGVYEQKDSAVLPVIDKKTGLTPFKAYRKSFDRAAVGSKPIIALIVTDVGLSNAASQTVLSAMSSNITLAISPYAATPDMWLNEARKRGHETWLALPTEPIGYPAVDPGPQTLLISAPQNENMMKLNWILSRVPGYAGVISTPDSTFIASPNDMRPVVTDIYNRGLGFVDAAETPAVTARAMALGQKSPYANVDVLVDRELNAEDIKTALARLEDKAKQQGFATGMIRTRALSLGEIQVWQDSLAQKGFVLAPLSAIAGPGQ